MLYDSLLNKECTCLLIPYEQQISLFVQQHIGKDATVNSLTRD